MTTASVFGGTGFLGRRLVLRTAERLAALVRATCRAALHHDERYPSEHRCKERAMHGARYARYR